MGLTSDSFSMRVRTSSSSTPVASASCDTISSISPSGRNSWRGGSRRRITTGSPANQSPQHINHSNMNNSFILNPHREEEITKQPKYDDSVE